jgi:hypothetical protein
MRSSPLGSPGVAGLVLLAAGLFLVLAMKLLHWMFMEEIYYSSALRGVYDFVRRFL